MCCCGCSLCKICTLMIVLIVAIGFIFGWGVFSHGFDKLKNTVHMDVNGGVSASRPFLGFGAPVAL
ncbi:hypothetical protein ACHQM5_017669 [Ranunculus cassubicifolius]